MNSHALSVFLRSCLLFLLSFFITVWLFSNIRDASQSRNTLNEKEEIAYAALPIKDFLKDFSPVFQVPFFFLRFNVYATNNVVANLEDKHATSTLLNLDVLGKYTGDIKTGQTAIVREDISSYDASGLVFSRSFFVDATSTPNGSYVLFVWPTSKTFLLIWLLIIVPVTYALIVIFSSCLRFLLTGEPLSEAISDYKDKINRN
jgi:hypothetical protein